MHCHQYSHKKRWWQILFVCSTTPPHCIKTLQVLWYKLKQFMRASGHRAACWQLCRAASWLWFLAPSVPSALHRQQTLLPPNSTLTQRQSCSQTSSSHQEVSKKTLKNVGLKDFGKFDSLSVRSLAYVPWEQPVYFSTSTHLLHYILTYTCRYKNSCKS